MEPVLPCETTLAHVPANACPGYEPGGTPAQQRGRGQRDDVLAARDRLVAAMTVLAGLSFGCAIAGWVIGGDSELIGAYFFTTQDAPVLLAFGVFFVVATAALRKNWALDWALHALRPIDPRRARHLAALVLVLACGLIWIGTHLVYRSFGLAMDEFMADFDAGIIARGKLLAVVASEWRDYVPALQPIFRLELPGNAHWSSAYLPMNAAIRALFVLLGAPIWQGIVLAGAAIIAVFAVARRLWPDRPDAAVVAAALVACSSQLLITAMTPYAMTAHLALNMIWLWLFLRDTPRGHALAAVVAFVACGLHQIIFHPFAAPFVISLMRARRWKLAAWYVTAYAAIGLFWVLYWTIVLRAVNASVAPAADLGVGGFIRHVAGLIDLSPGGAFFMGLNLLRFLAWQSPIVIPLACVGLLARQNRNRTIADLAAGMALTLIAMLLLMPFQGHGWGYRYLHGFLGGLALIAAQGWICLTDGGEKPSRTPALVLAASVVVSLVVVLPWQAYQVHAFVAPYASAVTAIERAKADVVLVDPVDIWYGEDLVRNDPFLRVPPKVLSLPRLDEPRLRALCQRYGVAIFDRDDARRLGIRGMPNPASVVEHDRALRALAQHLNCGHSLLGSGS
jgi:hypothetical protein